MEHSYSGTSDDIGSAGRRIQGTVVEGVRNVTAAASGEIKSLIADVEDLVARIADLKDFDVVRMREKVVNAIGAAKESMSDGAESLKRQAQQVATTADDYVHDSPWQAVGIAALVGAALGILATRRS